MFVLQNSDAMQNLKQCIQTMRFSLARSAALAGKTAIVTASTDGIGLAIARRLGQDGAKVWISSRKESNVDSALTSLKNEGLDVDGLGKVRHYNCYHCWAFASYQLITYQITMSVAVNVFEWTHREFWVSM